MRLPIPLGFLASLFPRRDLLSEGLPGGLVARIHCVAIIDWFLGTAAERILSSRRSHGENTRA